MESILRGFAYAAVVIAAIVIIMLLIGAISRFFERRIIPDRYEWLAVMSHFEWRKEAKIKEEMRKLKKTRSAMYVMDADLDHLLKEGLIECHRFATRRIAGSKTFNREYRLTPLGTRKKDGIHKKEDVLSPDLRIV